MRKSNSYLIAIIFYASFLLSCSCTKEDNSISTSKDAKGVITEKQYLWWNKEEEHDQSIQTTGHFYNGAFLCESHLNGISSLALTEAKSGRFRWKWKDYLNPNDLSIGQPYSFENYLYILNGSPRSYCIDMKTGKIIWNKIFNESINARSYGYKNEVYILQDHPDDGAKYTGFKIYDLETGDFKDKIIPKFVNEKNLNVIDELGGIFGIARIDTLGKTYYSITYAEAINTKQAIPLISLYNYTDKKWIYEYKKITNLEITPKGYLFINNNKIYHEGESRIFCNDLWTGDSIWTQEFKGNFLFGSCTYDNGTLYCAAEGDGYYALDAETGAIKWKGERAPGTSSRMVVLNGVLYYINGGDGRLWALDAATGKTLWRLKSPDGYSFKREINVMQGDGERKGYVLTSTWHGACAYEAER